MKKALSSIIERLISEIKETKVSCSNELFDKIEITSIVFDSRKVNKGCLFFALPGTHIHGNTFVAQAIKDGAAAVCYQDELSNDALDAANKFGTVLINVPSSRFAMAPVADEFYDSPSKKMIVIGVTGTEGKSSTVSFIWQLLRLCNQKAGFISTVQYSIGEDAIKNPEHQTTPEAPIVQSKLYEMLQNGCKYAVVESSSHGLSKKLNRLGNVNFDCAVMMNVTLEHLEFHGTLEQYKFDKANLFRSLDECSHTKYIDGKSVSIPTFGVVNADDASAEYFKDATTKPIYSFSKKAKSNLGNENYFANNIKNDEKGSDFNVEKLNLRINLPGEFNVYNTLAASIVVSKLLNKDLDFVQDKLPLLEPICGRMTVIAQGQPFEVIVDYAHTPSSFTTIFPPIRSRCKGRIISLFGSGGERDIQKRPMQGKIAAEYSDIIFLTDEDPRNEDSVELLEMIAAGCPERKRNEDLFLIPDRPTAIRKAFSLAKENDIVLLLGKAHENSIIYKDHVMPYDEISEAKNALAEQGYKK